MSWAAHLCCNNLLPSSRPGQACLHGGWLAFRKRWESMQALLRPHLRTGPALLLPVLLAKASQLSSKRRGNEWSCSHITKVWIIATKSLIHCMFIEYLLWALLTNRQTVPETKISKTRKASSTLDHHMFQVCSTPTTLYMASISAW